MSKLAVTIGEHTYEIDVNGFPQKENLFSIQIGDETLTAIVPDLERPLEEIGWLVVDGRPYEIVFDRDLRWIRTYSGMHRVDVRDMEAVTALPRSTDGRVKAPIPGLISRVLVTQGQAVEAGQPLLILEAMKMENEIRAPAGGQVSALHVTAGQSVARNEVLAEIEAA